MAVALLPLRTMNVGQHISTIKGLMGQAKAYAKMGAPSAPGVPDVNGCASFGEFWIELKVAKHNKVALSPHQISFHVLHPENTFILVKTKDACRLYLGKQVRELFACGCSLAPVACGWKKVRLWLEDLGGDDTLAYP